MLAEASTVCASCGEALNGTYCSRCGERALAHDEYSLRSFLADAFRDLTSLDAKLYRTLWLLVRRPGQLTLEFLRGKRVPYLRPLQLFLLANLVYFVVQPRTGYTGFNTPLGGQVDGQFYSQALGIRQRVEQRVAERGTTFQNYRAAFDARSSLYARSLTALMVPLLTLVAALVFAGRRRPLAGHLVFATHFMAWQLIVVMSAFLLLLGALSPYLHALFEWGSAAGVPGMESLSLIVTEFGSLILVAPYFYLAAGRVYRSGRLFSAFAAMMLTLSLLPVILAYRLVLFWLTFVTI